MQNQSRTFLGSLAVSTIASFLLYLFAGNFVSFIDKVLNEDFNITMGLWELSHIAFAVPIGTLPLFAWIGWKVRQNYSYKILLQYNLMATLVFIMVIVLTFFFLLLRAKHNPLLPKRFVILPSLYFWNFVLVIASVLSASSTIIFGVIRRNNSRSIVNSEQTFDD